ncbi:uncharacterized protein LOC143285081 [Babylonia areolata]|uniref:uncharacterized protein LOC143285081 n=1 Tax=Babylonia areolata TaxID=304850 RepID=UPI003FD01FFF
MSAGDIGLVCALILSLCDAVSGELCYVDSNTGSGVYCEPHCCGTNPTYCCDKDPLIIQSAVMGSLGVIFIIGMVACCVYKKKKRDQRKAAMQQATAKVKAATSAPNPAVSAASPPVTGGAVNEGFRGSEQSEEKLSQPAVSPDMSEAMYSQQHYPPPATPTFPPLTHVIQSPEASEHCAVQLSQ